VVIARCRRGPHDGESMPKQLMMRWVLGIAVVSMAALGAIIGWPSPPTGIGRMSGSPSVYDQSDFARRRDELLFLKAAFDRLEAESKQDPNGPAFRSLRAEQEAIVLRMREVARPLPAESLPAALRALAKDAPRTVAEPTLAAPPEEARGSAAASSRLKVGLGSRSAVPDLALSRDPALNLVILIARPRAPRPASEVPSDGAAEPLAATTDAKPAAKPRAAERSAPRTPVPGTAGFTEPSRSEPATASR
jgi:hypothetical protein